MANILADFGQQVGKIKDMNAVNNGPVIKTALQTRYNFDDYKRAEIPYARTHDASYFSGYGGEHCVDVPFVFPNFDADENDALSYDFQLTDEYLKNMLDAGTEPYFRLGTKIEHWSKKYNTLPPKDFAKWARICEHIIMHYTEGWADGFKWKITYWEIWNEADGTEDNAPPQNKLCWGGTKSEFFTFYKTVALHLKGRFPHLKIGGPAVCSVTFGYMWGLVPALKPWIKDFLAYMSQNNVPIDFFSWHCYTNSPQHIATEAVTMRKALDKYGYENTESHLNEWNYTIGFRGDSFVQSIKGIIGMIGSAFTAATMCACQKLPIDMLMYYDARPCVFNGMFDFYTMKPLKGYFPFVTFAKLKALNTEVYSKSSDSSVFCLAAKNENGKKALQIVHYTGDKPAKTKVINITLKNAQSVASATIFSDAVFNKPIDLHLDADGKIKLSLPPNSFVYIELT